MIQRILNEDAGSEALLAMKGALQWIQGWMKIGMQNSGLRYWNNA